MKNINIDQILNKYWEGETSLEEEKLLRAYFSSNLVEKEHISYKPLFDFFSREKEQGQRVISSPPSIQKRTPFLGNFVSSHRFAIGIAASLVFLVAVIIGLKIDFTGTDNFRHAKNYTYIDEKYDVEEAYALTKEALSFLSIKIQEGQTEVTKNLNQIQRIDIMDFQSN